MIIIGITGTLGAGKGTIVEYLTKNKGFKHFSVRGLLTEMLLKENKEVNRDTMVELANKLRAEFGPNYLAVTLLKQAQLSKENAIIESLRTPAEIESLRDNGKFYLFAVDAEPNIRYERITQRASETDKVTFEEFLSNEEREMENQDPNKQNLGKCILMADFKFDNNDNIESLYEKVEKTIEEIEKQNS